MRKEKMSIKFKVKDVVGKVLDKHDVRNVFRLPYRGFARHLLTFASKGRATVKLRDVSRELGNKRAKLLKEAGLRPYVKERMGDSNVTVWTRAESVEEFVTAYEILYNLSAPVLRDIIRAFNRSKVIYKI